MGHLLGKEKKHDLENKFMYIKKKERKKNDHVFSTEPGDAIG